MSAPEGKVNSAPDDEQELSPAEKLADDRPAAESVPGAQNPESEAIKQEQRPNTE